MHTLNSEKMNNRIRTCLLISNLSFPFVSSIGVKLTLPNFFLLPVCLLEPHFESQMLGFVFLAIWACLWFVIFSNKAKSLFLGFCQAVLLTQVIILGYEAMFARGIKVLLSPPMIPSYIFVLCCVFIGREYYRLWSLQSIQNTK